MKYRRLLISLALLLAVLAMLVGCASGEETEAALISADNVSGDLIYSIYAGNTVTITGYTGTERDLVLPDQIDTRPVTAIGADAFANCSGIVHLTIGKQVKTIGDGTFYG